MATRVVCSNPQQARRAALRAARAYTGRALVVALPSPELPRLRESLAGEADVEFCEGGGLAKLCRTLGEADDRIAAIVVEPAPGGGPIYKRFLKKARELASAEGAVLIWDETLTDTAAFPGGLQVFYKIKPDLSCLPASDAERPVRLDGKTEILEHEAAL
jgi:glutamate-1-semialdehyde aminotransferase